NIQIGPNIIFDPEAISFYGGQIHNIRLIGLEIRNTGSHDCISFGDFAGVPNAIGYPTGIEVIDNHLHDCGVAGGQHCMYACSPGTIVRGNHMHSCGSSRLQWYDSGRERCGANAEIYGNYFHESQQGQFRSGDCHDCSGEVTLNFGDNIKFYNNVIKGVGQFGGGMELGRNSTSGHIYNNTITTPSGNSAIGLGNVNGVTIRNNITYGSAVPIATRSDSDNVVADYNSGQDPRFQPCGVANNPTDAYCIASDSPMRNSGMDLSGQGFNTDYLGRLRGQGTGWDIGAYEYVEGGPPPPTCPPDCPPPACPPNCPTVCPPNCPSGPAPGSLSVSPSNGRYFVNPAGQIVYLTGAYSWNFASDMPDAERAAYLNYVVAHNQNIIRSPSQVNM